MRLVTAHKILIGSTIALFLLFAAVQLRGYASSGSVADLVSGVGGAVAAVGFAIYLRAVYARAKQPDR